MPVGKSLRNCRVCDASKVTVKMELASVPIHLWPLENIKDYEEAPLVLFQCEQCGHLQLQNFSEDFISNLYRHESGLVNDEPIKKRRKEFVENFFGREFFGKSSKSR